MKTTLHWDRPADIEPLDNTVKTDELTIISYANNRFFIVLLNKTEAEVEAYFEERMCDRTEYEADDEGWDGRAITIPLTDGITWLAGRGVMSEQFNGLAADMLKHLFGTNQ